MPKFGKTAAFGDRRKKHLYGKTIKASDPLPGFESRICLHNTIQIISKEKHKTLKVKFLQNELVS
jgi:hypothetical protein